MAEHIVPIRVYAIIFAALLVLTATTCAISFINLGRINAVVALVIAFGKALLVALFFMHLRYSGRLMQVVVVGGLFWLGIMIALTMSDFLTRGWLTYR
ncbi:MAG TPA: cytochrome C oxidase subunit IV family protein [Pyrinomonadaceae bacterium]|nr:cytochrome C oxidase subunit IV family protein [Pyrinomonadaceae bacterium]